MFKERLESGYYKKHIPEFKADLEKENGTDIFSEGSRELLFNMANYNSGNEMDIDKIVIEYAIIAKRTLEKYHTSFK